MLWEALTLRRLFKGGNDNDTLRQVLEMTIPKPSLVNKDSDPAFDPIVMGALERDPARRTATARQLSLEIEEVLHQRRYPRRNDAIARYMQSTFAAHLDARKRLLQEVSSKGAASDDVLVAAFADEPPIDAPAERSDALRTMIPAESVGRPVLRSSPTAPALARTSTPMPVVRPSKITDPPPLMASRARTASINDLSIRIKNSGVMTVAAPPSSVEVPPSLLEPEERSDDLRTIPVGGDRTSRPRDVRSPTPAPPILARPSAVMPRATASSTMRAEEPSTNASAAAELVRSRVTQVELDQIDDQAPDEEAPLPRKRNVGFLVALGAVAVAATVFIVVSRRGGHTPKEAADPTAVHVTAQPAPAQQQPPPADPPKPPPAPPTQTDVKPRPPPTSVPEVLPVQPVAPSDKATPDDLFKVGMQAHARGDARGALAALKKAQQLDPQHAQSLRALGLVYEELGDRASAKAAYRRYLTVAPSADDAAQIRNRIEAL